MKKIYASIDCGSSDIKVVVGEIVEHTLQVLASSSVKSNGIKKGVVTNLDQAVVSIREAVNEVEQILGVTLDSVIVGIPSIDIQMIHSQGFTTITNDERMVEGDDVVRAISASVHQKIAEDRELVAIVPKKFSLDGKDFIKEPKGMIGLTLGVKTTLITAPKDIVYTLLLAVEKAGLSILDISLSSYVVSEHFLNDESLSDCFAVVNIGGDSTSITMYEELELTGVQKLDLGGENIVRDIAYIYKVSMDDARKVFQKFGVATIDYASSDEIIETKTVSGEEVVIKHHELAEIIEARLDEIVGLIKETSMSMSKQVVSDFIITGGITELEGMERKVQLDFGFNSKVGQVLKIGARHAKFATCIGLINNIYKKNELRAKSISSLSANAQREITAQKKQKSFKIDEDSVLGKVFGFFFE